MKLHAIESMTVKTYFIWQIILEIRISDILIVNGRIHIMIYLEIIPYILIGQCHKLYISGKLHKM